MEKTKQKKEVKINRKTKARRINVRLYPIYKMFSWDNICFYSIEFLFYTITKKISVSEILIINAFYILFKIIAQVPAVVITDYFKYKKSIIIGNLITVAYILTLIFSQGAIGVIIADFLCALGYAIKNVSETNLLYDSVSTRGGEGLYSKIDSQGTSWYYLLDTIMAVLSGYLFVINNYLPMFVCLGFTIISTILSTRFEDIHRKHKDEQEKISQYLKEYSADLKKSMKFIINSARLRSYITFGAIFYGIYSLIDVYKSNLLIANGSSEQEYAMIFALLTLLASISAKFSRKFHKKFRNKSLTIMSLTYVAACVIIGIATNIFSPKIALPIIIVMYTILKMDTAIWLVLKQKYIKNFTTDKTRTKISFTFEFCAGIVASIFLILGSLLLQVFNIQNSFILVSLIALLFIVLCLDYMKGRFGLKAKEYKKEDIELQK